MLNKRAAFVILFGSPILALTACGDDRTRTAEAETAVSEAQVTTDLPPGAMSDEQLQATANAAADQAATFPSAGPGPEAITEPGTLQPQTQPNRAGTAADQRNNSIPAR
jgi:hypothetical protein